jgi:hypothetical protein
MALEESERSVQMMLTRILQCLDNQVTLGDKRHEEQTAFIAQVSHELQGVRKQLEVTVAEVDEARRRPDVGSAVYQPSSPAFAAAMGGAGLAAARLANDGPPLIPATPRFHSTKFSLSRSHVRHNAEPNQHRYRDRDEDTGYVKPSKHDFPRFDGYLPNLWLDRCVAYFELYCVKPQQWVTTASLYVDGHAAFWLQAFRQTHVQVSWTQFCQAVVEEFRLDEFEGQMHKLLQLRQTGTVAEYRRQFEIHMYHLLSLDPSLSSKFFVTQFVLGLKDEIRMAVRIQAPTSIMRATVFAKIQEEEMDSLASVLLQRDDHHRSQLHCIHDLLLLRLCPRQGAMSLSVSVSCVTIGVLTICVSNVVRDIHEIINASGKAPNF